MTEPQKLWIEGRFPGLNDILEAAHKRQRIGTLVVPRYVAMKRNYTEIVIMTAKAQAIRPVERAFFVFRWVEKDRRRDLDNIAAARKFVLDGLVEAGVLKTDGWNHVSGWIDKFEVIKAKPGVEVEIYESSDSDFVVGGGALPTDFRGAGGYGTTGAIGSSMESCERARLGAKPQGSQGATVSWPTPSCPQWQRIRLL